MRGLPFVDAHVHLWDLKRIHYPWLTPPFADDGPNGSVAPIAFDYRLDDYLAEAAGWNVAGIVHVDAGADPAQALDETDWLQGIADESGMPNAIIAFAALDDPDVKPCSQPRPAGERPRHPPHRQLARRSGSKLLAARRYRRRGLGAGLRPAFEIWPVLRPPGLSRPVCRLRAADRAASRDPGDRQPCRHGRRWRGRLALGHEVAGVASQRRGQAFGDGLRLPSVPRRGGAPARAGDHRPVRRRALPARQLRPTAASLVRRDDGAAEAVADFTENERRALFARNANRIYRLGLDV